MFLDVLEFAKWIRNHKRNYASLAESDAKLRVFDYNRKQVELHNTLYKKGKVTWKS